MMRLPVRHLWVVGAMIGLLLTGCGPSATNMPASQPSATTTSSLAPPLTQASISTLILPAAQTTTTRTGTASATIPVVASEPPAKQVTLAPSATEGPRSTPSIQPSENPTATSLPTEPTSPPSSSTKPVLLEWGELTINTYDYESALYTNPQQVGHPYPLLHEDRVGPPRPRRYRVLRLRNEYLELTLLPELGGRIYQCRFLPTGQNLFYNNPVIKPSHWGPQEQGWWLAAGGMEFCLPVEEHGYVTAQPWETIAVNRRDGSVVATAQILEQSRNIQVRIEITLRPAESAFHLRTTIMNRNDEATALQFWINAMLSPGAPSVQPSLIFYYPASEVIVHSRGERSLPDAGQVMSWPIYEGRDWSQYDTWGDWLGFFAPSLHAPFTAVYDTAAELGMVRVFPLAQARGAKLFGFGAGFADADSYTDNGSQYVEMWGGWTPTFWDYGTIGPKGVVEWDETWYVLSKSGGPSLATAKASVHVQRQGSALQIKVACPTESQWLLVVKRNDQALYTQPIQVRPEAPFATKVKVQESIPSEELHIELIDERGRPEISFHPGSW